MARTAVSWAERATGDALISPDLAINMELCDAINKYPGQAKDALKVIKKRLGNKRPFIQLLALFALDAIIKNCGDNVILQIIERGILHEMVAIVRKKPNISVKERILILVDAWQQDIGVKFPQFIQTFYSMRDIGLEFPREVPQVKPSGHSSNFKEVTTPASLKGNLPPLSMTEMRTAEELANILMEMLDVLDLNNSEAIKQELIVDLTEQCQGFQKRVQSLINDTADESLLFKGLEVNDNLQRVLRRREDLANGITFTPRVKIESSAPPFIGADHFEDEVEEDYPHLAPRYKARRSISYNEAAQQIPYDTPTSFSRMQSSTNTGAVDYLSGDNIYTSDRDFRTNFSSSGSKFPSAPPTPFRYDKQPVYYDENASLARVSDTTLPASWESPASTSLPPLIAINDQRQELLEQNEEFGSSYENLFISRHSSPLGDKDTEDALFRDLVEFVKARESPSSSTSKSSRSYRD